MTQKSQTCYYLSQECLVTENSLSSVPSHKIAGEERGHNQCFIFFLILLDIATVKIV